MLKWGVYFWGSFLDQLLNPTWVKIGSKTGGGLTLSWNPTPPSHTCSGKTDRKVPKVTMVAFMLFLM